MLPKVAVIFHHLGPYHHARLNEAAKYADTLGIEWSRKEVYRWGSEPRGARYKKISLFEEASAGRPARPMLRNALSAALDDSRPDVVAVNGWGDFGSMASADCCLRCGIPMVVMSESTVDDDQRSSWREGVKRRIVSLYSAALVGGQRHFDYLTALGMPRERIFAGYDAVDNRYFEEKVAEVRNRSSKVREKYGLPEKYFLASARFIPKKNLPALIRAYAEYRRKVEGRRAKVETRSDFRPPTTDIWSLVLLGDGPLKSDLRHLISDLGLDEHVHLPGFKQYDELPVYYGLAKAFVHTSTTEQWGLVVNEAMASGLPVIVSNRCGCVPELVREGVNGFTFDPFDEQELMSRLHAISSMPEKNRAELGAASSKIVAGHDAEQFGKGLERAVQMALVNPRKPSVMGKLLVTALAHR